LIKSKPLNQIQSIYFSDIYFIVLNNMISFFR